MAAQTRATLKTYFEAGDTPTAAQFIDLIDSFQLISDFIIDDDTGDVITADGDVVTDG